MCMWRNLSQYFDEPHEIIGWIGMLLLLSAYTLLSVDVFTRDTVLYHAMNVIGSFGIMYTSFKTRAYPPALMNVIWIGVACYALATLLL